MSDNQELTELLEQTQDRPNRSIRGSTLDAPSSQPPSSQRQDLDLCQWQVCPNGVFRPAAKTIESLKPGSYKTDHDTFGPYLVEHPLLSDEIIELPDSPNIDVLMRIQKFWTRRDKYARKGLLFKRGIFMWGAPGSGKTVGIHLLSRDLIENGGIVLFCSNPQLMLTLLSAVRRIERGRPLIVVMEDIDEIIDQWGEHDILAMLDGEHQTDNVVYVATTNYPAKLGARILNRPSRFDERIKISPPTENARRAYLKKASEGDDIDDDTIERWVRDTEGFTVAHLRELVAGMLCLDQSYAEVLDRLRSMRIRPKEEDGMGSGVTGFMPKIGTGTACRRN